ncbi:Trans-aconitate 2-methyltransferase [Pseudomonas sp. 8Z]|uniref:trans-aconitate 2-methyltransferase n=1 Tax=Pseudomonas sp. 8Z TaxID=2653166 RepID=UPI0012F09ED7|nr:trans-aconitate 2-methyltransferase [Pseudomonas sp. 8Z]VXD01254.1 Trans-aconitate 2-methyltransferase [Pseudomonas sp. 8Z]
MGWSAQQYSLFERQRTRPVCDLLAAVPSDGIECAVDLGCGPGNSTEVLHRHVPGAQVSAIDSSEDMLRAARQRLPQVSFQLADIQHWQADAVPQLILANASLQWLPDHAQLYPKLLAQLAPGGWLAIQTPDNLQEPAHRLAREVAANGPWSACIGEVRHNPRYNAQTYYDILSSHAGELDIWRTTYFHVLDNAAAIVEWFKSTALLPFLQPLDAEQQAAFLANYQKLVADAYPPQADGRVLLPFPRLFIVARR